MQFLFDFQDHFDKADSTITSFGADLFDKGYNMVVDGSELKLTGDGTTQMWDAIGYSIRNQNTFEEQVDSCMEEINITEKYISAFLILKQLN